MIRQLDGMRLFGAVFLGLWRYEAATTSFEGFDIPYCLVSGFRATGSARRSIGFKRSSAATGFLSIRDVTRLRRGSHSHEVTAVRPLAIASLAVL